MMKYSHYHFVMLLFFLVLIVNITTSEAGELQSEMSNSKAPSVAPIKTFTVFDATLYKHKPNLANYGLQPLTILYFADFYAKGEAVDKLPNRNKVKELARRIGEKNGMLVIDIEHWPVRGVPVVVDESARKYSELIRWFHEDTPGVQVGAYAIPPIQDYWRAIKGSGHEEYQAWQAENNRLFPVARNADAVFPSIYTFYLDRSGWVKYATEQIREARRFGKPVYVFLWPQFHDSNRLLGGRFLPADYWRLELETVWQHADGIVIWGGWGGVGPAEWDDSAPWWQVTKAFMSKLR